MVPESVLADVRGVEFEARRYSVQPHEAIEAVLDGLRAVAREHADTLAVQLPASEQNDHYKGDPEEQAYERSLALWLLEAGNTERWAALRHLLIQRVIWWCRRLRRKCKEGFDKAVRGYYKLDEGDDVLVRYAVETLHELIARLLEPPKRDKTHASELERLLHWYLDDQLFTTWSLDEWLFKKLEGNQIKALEKEFYRAVNQFGSLPDRDLPELDEDGQVPDADELPDGVLKDAVHRLLQEMHEDPLDPDILEDILTLPQFLALLAGRKLGDPTLGADRLLRRFIVHEFADRVEHVKKDEAYELINAISRELGTEEYKPNTARMAFASVGRALTRLTAARIHEIRRRDGAPARSSTHASTLAVCEFENVAEGEELQTESPGPHALLLLDWSVFDPLVPAECAPDLPAVSDVLQRQPYEPPDRAGVCGAIGIAISAKGKPAPKPYGLAVKRANVSLDKLARRVYFEEGAA